MKSGKKRERERDPYDLLCIVRSTRSRKTRTKVKIEKGERERERESCWVLWSEIEKKKTKKNEKVEDKEESV